MSSWKGTGTCGKDNGRKKCLRARLAAVQFLIDLAAQTQKITKPLDTAQMIDHSMVQEVLAGNSFQSKNGSRWKTLDPVVFFRAEDINPDFLRKTANLNLKT